MSRHKNRTAHAYLGTAILAFCLMLGAASKARATTVSTNNATGLTITITPNADRGVEISSGAAATWTLGNVNANVTTQTVVPATITIVGNMGATEVNVHCSTAGKMALSTDGTVGGDKGYLALMFTSIAQASAPAVANFDTTMVDGGDLVQFGPTYQRAGNNGTALAGTVVTGTYEGPFNNGTLDNTSDMDGLATGRKRHVYLLLGTPSSYNSMTTATAIELVFQATSAQ